MTNWNVCGIAVAGLFVASATADLKLLDIPSGTPGTPDFVWSSSGGSGFSQQPFTIESESLVWRGAGHATEGVVRAWDYEEDTAATGLVTFTAVEGYSFERLHFDVSGFMQYERQAAIQIYLDGELFRDYVWNFNGNSTLTHWGATFEDQLGVPNPSEISISLTYFDGVQYAAGLDNIELTAVPGPGALALLGVAGVVGRRRRRTTI